MRKSDGTVAAWIGATSREFTDEDAVACTLPFPIYLYGNHNEARPAMAANTFSEIRRLRAWIASMS